MTIDKRTGSCWMIFFWVVLTCAVFSGGAATAGDLQDVKKSGVLRHIGIPYANFVTGDGDGMDVELMQKFAKSLGVRYQYVKSDWDTIVGDLIGKKVKTGGETVEILTETPVRGDLIANGFTILPWRQTVVDFSRPTFPSQIWLVARADSKIRPIKPTNHIDRDIAQVKSLLKGRKVLALKKTCLDPDLYNLSATGADVVCFTGSLNELAPAIINGVAEMTILDVPDALIALDKWPGKIKIIGPISPRQEMAAAFPKNSVQLREAFDQFLRQCRKDGSYDRIVKKYYPTAFAFFPEFFKNR
jgi:ABC-type amino acid transport substrate-binding protein